MKQLTFDSGIKEFKINNNGVLRFNPSDPNLYSRFMEAAGKIQAVEEKLINDAKKMNSEGGDNHGELVLQLLTNAYKEVKKILTEVFGKENDFDQILDGVNLLAVGTNGERVITNFLSALLPVFQDGIEGYIKQTTNTAVQKAQQNRAARRAKK